MRILLVTPMPPRSEAPGAIPLVLHAALSGLRSRHDVTLVTVAGDEPGEFEAALELAQSDSDVHVVDRRQPTGIARWRRRRRLAAAWARGRYPWRTVWFADPSVQRTIDQLVASRRFDVAAIHDDSLGVFSFPATLPTVLTEHEVVDWRPAPRSVSPLRPVTLLAELDRRRWRRYQPAIWRRFDRVEVFSARDAGRVAEIAPDLGGRVRVNPFGIELPAAPDTAREEQDLMLFVGNYTHPPNVDAARWLARDIMPLVLTSRPSARLVLVGTAAPPEVRTLAQRSVAVVGEVPEMRPWLERATVVVAPVRHGGGMRMKVLQALASGKAVVATPRGAEGLLLSDEEEAPLLLAERAGDFAGALTGLLVDRPFRLGLGARARAFVAAHHSAAAYGARLEAVYEELLNECQEAAAVDGVR
jgi:glycosyltransferase involved in cell wall biosynthesis